MTVVEIAVLHSRPRSQISVQVGCDLVAVKASAHHFPAHQTVQRAVLAGEYDL